MASDGTRARSTLPPKPAHKMPSRNGGSRSELATNAEFEEPSNTCLPVEYNGTSARWAAGRLIAGHWRWPPSCDQRLPIGWRRVVRSKANAGSQVNGIVVPAYSSEKSVLRGVFVPVLTTM